MPLLRVNTDRSSYQFCASHYCPDHVKRTKAMKEIDDAKYDMIAGYACFSILICMSFNGFIQAYDGCRQYAITRIPPWHDY